MKMYRHAVGFSCAAQGVLAACGGGTGPTPPAPPPPPPSPVASVEISPGGLTLPVGGTGKLNAVAKDVNGAALSGITISWSTVSHPIATVASDGTVTGNAVGQTLAIAAAGAKADTVDVIVIANFTLEVTPITDTIIAGQTRPYTVVARDGAGRLIPTPPVAWSSSNLPVATISTTGVATGVSGGDADIVAKAGQVESPPAVLTVLVPAVGPCFGIGSNLKFRGTISYGFKAVKIPNTSGTGLIDADDGGHLIATMTQTINTPFTASWSGDLEATSNASVTQKLTDGANVSTYSSTDGRIRQLPGGPFPQMGLIVDLSTCNYRVVTAALVNTILTDRGNRLEQVDEISGIQFTGSVPSDWQIAGLGRNNATMPAHSAGWLAFNINETALLPLGFAVSLFDGSPNEASAGQASGGLQVVVVH